MFKKKVSEKVFEILPMSTAVHLKLIMFLYKFLHHFPRINFTNCPYSCQNAPNFSCQQNSFPAHQKRKKNVCGTFLSRCECRMINDRLTARARAYPNKRLPNKFNVFFFFSFFFDHPEYLFRPRAS